jgi:hypothetical protein
MQMILIVLMKLRVESEAKQTTEEPYCTSGGYARIAIQKTCVFFQYIDTNIYPAVIRFMKHMLTNQFWTYKF